MNNTRRHGHAISGARSRAYTAWDNMLRRCRNPRNPGWKRYGGRGITVCDRWTAFENFLADMGEPPAGHSLDRIDNNDGYAPSNCRWATPLQQGRNSRRNRWIEYQGRSQPLSVWCEELGLNPKRISGRLSRGKSVEQAFTAPFTRMNATRKAVANV